MNNDELFDYIKLLEDKIQHLEFRILLLKDRNNTNDLILDYNITQEQYSKIMDIMDEFRKLIGEGKEVHHGTFETKIREIVNNRQDMDYHFCEDIARAFMEDRRWEEVFPKLYGDMDKYQCLMQDN